MSLLRRMFGREERVGKEQSVTVQKELIKEIQESKDITKEVMTRLRGAVSKDPYEYRGAVNVFYRELERSRIISWGVGSTTNRVENYHNRDDISDKWRFDSYSLGIKQKMDYYGLAGNLFQNTHSFRSGGPNPDRIIHVAHWEDVEETDQYTCFPKYLTKALEDCLHNLPDCSVNEIGTSRMVTSGIDIFSLTDGHIRKDRFYGKMKLIGKRYDVLRDEDKERMFGVARWIHAMWHCIEEEKICLSDTSGCYNVFPYGNWHNLDSSGIMTVFHERVE